MTPHRDIRPALRAWQADLFTRGICGAWSFPPVVPLAPLVKPLAAGDLAALARLLREMTRPPPGPFPPDGTARKPPRPIFFATAGEPFFVEAGNILLWGLPLTAGESTAGSFSASLFSALPDGEASTLPAPVFARPFLVSFVTERDPAEIARARCAVEAAPPPEIRFRAAAVANLSLAPLGSPPDACSFSWKLGKFHWLPRA